MLRGKGADSLSSIPWGLNLKKRKKKEEGAEGRSCGIEVRLEVDWNC